MVLTATSINITVFGDVTPCGFVFGYLCFGETVIA